MRKLIEKFPFLFFNRLTINGFTFFNDAIVFQKGKLRILYSNFVAEFGYALTR